MLRLTVTSIYVVLGISIYGQCSTTIAEYFAQGGAQSYPEFTATAISTGPGVAPSSGTYYGASGWTTSSSSISTTDYFEFSIEPISGREMTLSKILTNFVRSSSGPISYEVWISDNGFSSSLNDNGLHTDRVSFECCVGTSQTEVSFTMNSSVNIDNTTSAITFRVYAFDAISSSGSLRTYPYSNSCNSHFGGDYSIQLRGTSSLVPATAAMQLEGDANVCQQDSSTRVLFTGFGLGPYTFDYDLNLGSIQTVQSQLGSDTVSILVPTGQTGNQLYRLRGVTGSNGSSTLYNGASSVSVFVQQSSVWYYDAEGDGLGDPDSTVSSCSQPVGFVSNNSDHCPNVTGTLGSSCDDGDPGTINDSLGLNCICVGETELLSLNAKVFLGGAYDAGSQLMNDDLRVLGFTPISEPYTGLGYQFVNGGGETVTNSILFQTTGDDAIVDWVVVELRDSAQPGSVVNSRAALVQRDGDVVDIEGNASLQLDVQAGNYFIAIRHRNHLGCMTASPISLSSSSTILDLTSSSTATWGVNSQKDFGGVQGLWEGDVSGDGKLKYTGAGNDRDLILIAIGGSIPTAIATGYHSEDINMDGMIKYTGGDNDRDIILVNIGGAIPTVVKQHQLP